jgi:hypothetical protein
LNEPPVAQDRDPLGDARKLLEPVRNVDDRDAVSFQPCNLFEEQIDFARGQHGRGLVEDEDACLADQIARDLDHLLVSDTECGDWRGGVDRVEADPRHRGTRLASEPGPVDPAERPGRAPWQPVEEDVFCDRERRQQIQFLHHHAHPERLGFAAACRHVGLAVQAHCARGRHDNSPEDL